ncbi:hypothetical protein ABT088_47655 [Streptomyces mirabilis]
MLNSPDQMLCHISDLTAGCRGIKLSVRYEATVVIAAINEWL